MLDEALPMRFLSLAMSFLLGTGALAQTVQPVIVEYRGRADGKFAVTNNTLTPMIVVLEPKSFSINPDGRGVFRQLDPDIHLELSSMSMKLQPKETYYIFYKATADKLPAWFTVYATFANPQHSEGLDVRMMLPHTVYLYQKDAIVPESLQVTDIAYNAGEKKITCNLENDGAALGRVQSVHATGDHATGEASGFPLLPGASRHVEVDWKEDAPPKEIEFRFERFKLKRPVSATP